jgi:hypothetical protein
VKCQTHPHCVPFELASAICYCKSIDRVRQSGPRESRPGRYVLRRGARTINRILTSATPEVATMARLAIKECKRNHRPALSTGFPHTRSFVAVVWQSSRQLYVTGKEISPDRPRRSTKECSPLRRWQGPRSICRVWMPRLIGHIARFYAAPHAPSFGRVYSYPVGTEREEENGTAYLLALEPLSKGLDSGRACRSIHQSTDLFP